MRLSAIRARTLLAAIFLTAAGASLAQTAYPSKTIRLITPYPAGGGTTVVAHLLGQKLTESWGQQVIVDNRPGGNTIIGTESLAKSPPDGYTLILVVSTYVIVPRLFQTPYDPLKDLAPVATVANSDYILVVHPSVPARSLKEFIALAKSRPGQINYGSTGSGGVQHLAGELMNMMAGIKMQHIPYKGSGQLLPAIVGGQIHMSFQTPPASLPYVKSGRLRPIANGGTGRLATLPDVPTFAEAGLPHFEVTTWFGVLAPAQTPRPIIDKLSAELEKILALSDIKERMASSGAEPFYSTPERFAALMKADMEKYAKVIKVANVKPE
jgi:tripartite-type tricarboxylate transporter receptor subunit TctC